MRRALTYLWCTSIFSNQTEYSDAGDHHDGSGLVSSSPESAAQADEIFAALPFDIMAIGNHELYSYASAKEIYDHPERW